MSKKVMLVDENQHGPAAIDENTGQIINIDTIHARVHAGQMFQADYMATGVANSGTIEMLVKCPVGSVVHMAFEVGAGGDAKLELFENPTVTVDGTSIAATNRNRRSSLVANATVFHTPTTTADGTALIPHGILVPGGSGGNSAGGQNEGFAEWVLKADEDYLIRLTNVSGTAQALGIELEWYEPNLA